LRRFVIQCGTVIAERGRPQMAHSNSMMDTLRYKPTLKVMKYLIALPLQRRLSERASVLWYKHIVFGMIYLFIYSFIHSFSSLSHDKSKASSKAICPRSAI
jgi:hypothetical protein